MAADGIMNSIRDALFDIFGRLGGRGQNAMAQPNLLLEQLLTGDRWKLRELIRLAQATPAETARTHAVSEFIESSDLPPFAKLIAREAVPLTEDWERADYYQIEFPPGLEGGPVRRRIGWPETFDKLRRENPVELAKCPEDLRDVNKLFGFSKSELRKRVGQLDGLYGKPPLAVRWDARHLTDRESPTVRFEGTVTIPPGQPRAGDVVGIVHEEIVAVNGDVNGLHRRVWYDAFSAPFTGGENALPADTVPKNPVGLMQRTLQYWLGLRPIDPMATAGRIIR